MADEGFDPEAFVKGTDDLPEITPSLTTFYYPNDPATTRAAGLDPAMEGGPTGAGKFSDVDLRNHTLEKFLNKESPFVAVAMPGEPTGAEFKLNVLGHNVVGKNVDTGGGLHGSHADIATSNPDLARTGIEHQFDPNAFISDRPAYHPSISATTVPDRMPSGEFDPRAFMSGETPAPDTSGVEDNLSTTDKLIKGLGQGLQDAGKVLGKLAASKPDPYQITTPSPFQLQGERSIPAELIPTVQSPLPQAAPAPLPTPQPMPPTQSILERAHMAFANFEAQNPYPQPIIPPAAANTLASLAFPQAAYTGQVIESGAGAISNFIQGHPISDITGMTPQTKALVGSANDPEPFSQERFNASMSMLAESGMMGAVSGPSHGMSREIPGAAAKPAAAEPGARPETVAAITEAKQKYGDEYTKALSEHLATQSATKVSNVGRGLTTGEQGVEIALFTKRFLQDKAKQAAAEPAKPPTPPEPPSPSEPLPQSEELNPVPGSGKFKRSYRVDKEMGDRMEGIGASRESGALQAELQSRNLLHELTKQQEHDFGKLLVSDRLKSVNPDHPQVLDPKTERAIASDPAIAKAFDYYVKEIKPEIEALRKRAGLSEKAAAGKGPGFISLIPTTNELLPPKPGGHIPQTSRLSRTTRFAKAAEGQAKEYSTNLREILRESYSEATRKARVADFYKATQARGITEHGTYEELPPQLQHDLTAATQPELNQMPIQRNPNFGLRTTLWDAMTRSGRGARSAFTGAALTANPPELFNHMRRQLNILASKPPVGEGVTARLEVLAPYFGPKIGAFKRAVMEDMSLPNNQQILQDIFDAGGGSTRSFEERYTSGIPGLKWLQGKTSKLLFGVPKGRGMAGWDLRMRVQLEKIRRAAEGNNDPQRIREFANQIGQYGSHTDWFVRGLRTVNPYAATTVPMRITEARTLVGGSGLKSQGIGMASLRRGETFLRGTGGTLLALASANYALSGKWPWENDAGHEFDLNMGVKDKDNKTIYVKTRAIAPELARPISMASIPDLLRERTAKNPDYLSAGAMGPLNTATSLVSGPAQNFALTATTGRVPYFLRRPGEGAQLMDISRLTKDEKQGGASRGVKQLKEAAKGINPIGNIFGDQFQVEAPGALHYMEEPIPGVKPFGNIYSTSYQPKDKSAPLRKPSSRGATSRRAGRRANSSR